MADPFTLYQPGAYTGADYYQRLAAAAPAGGGGGTPGGLAGAAGSSAQGAGQSALTSQIPGYMTSMGNIGTNIASETAGQVPDDVIAQLKQQGAEGNVSTGAASNASYLKALGLTSLGLEQTGLNNLESVESATPGYNVSQNPEFQTSAALQNEETTQQQVFALQQQQQQQALAQQQAALKAAQAGLNTNPWGGPSLPSGPAPGTDMLGQPNTTTATLPGQTAAGGGYNPWTGAAETPAVGGYNFDASNQPGSAGALSNWNTWNNTPVYPTTTGTGTNTADNWDYASEANPVDYYGGGDDSGD